MANRRYSPMRSSKRDWSELPSEEREQAAFAKIMRSVTAAEQSTAKMRKKLVSAGFPADTVDAAIDKACRLGLIDDKRYSECLVRSSLAMGKGLAFAEKEIEELGVSPYDLESYCDYLDQGEESHIQDAIDFLESHPPRGKNLRDSAFRKLVTKGYSTRIASSAARVYSENVLQ